MSLTISNAGISLIKQFEGCRLRAYRDAAGVITIGYGWTKAVNGKPLTIGTQITQEEAENLLREGIKTYEASVNKYDHIYHWTQNQFDALVSFAYNIGSIEGLTKRGNRSAAEIADCLISYNKAGGKVLSGLIKRRAAERELFLRSSYSHSDFIKGVCAALSVVGAFDADAAILPKTITVSRFKNQRHAVVTPIQLYLNSLGYPCGNPDGIAGAKFETAVKAFQKANGCIVDGELTAGKLSWKRLLKLS